MIRTTAAIGLFSLLTVLPLAARDATKPADDKAKLQGVWHSPADSKRQLKIMFLDDKVGYSVSDPAAKPPASTSSFTALSPAKFAGSGDKRAFEIPITKDTIRRVEYRFDKDKLAVTLEGNEYPVERVNTRAADSPAAKKLVGTWTVASVEAKGAETAGKNSGLEAVVFTEDRVVWKAPGDKEVLNAFFRYKPANKGPAEFDVFTLNPDFVIQAALEASGDEIRLAQSLKPAEKAAGRPIEFDTKKAEIVVIKAKRAK